MQKLVSVIVPIYNVEKFLDRCINSIINQTYKNLEIILVDDGSPDLCPKKCEEYAKIDNRIKVIHKENGGLSSARNAGLDVMTGDYVTFVDSDDVINENMIEIMLQFALEKDLKLVACEIERFSDENKIDKTVLCELSYYSYSKQQALKNTFVNYDHSLVTAWGKLYGKEIFDNLRFTNGRIHEDEFICHRIIDQIEEYFIIKQKLYYYFVNQDSITTKGYSLKRIDYLYALENRAEFFKQKYPEILKLLSTHILYMCIDLYFEIPEDYVQKKQAKKLTKNKFKQFKKYLKVVKIKSNIRFRIFSISPKLYKRLFR